MAGTAVYRSRPEAKGPAWCSSFRGNNERRFLRRSSSPSTPMNFSSRLLSRSPTLKSFSASSLDFQARELPIHLTATVFRAREAAATASVLTKSPREVEKETTLLEIHPREAIFQQRCSRFEQRCSNRQHARLIFTIAQQLSPQRWLIFEQAWHLAPRGCPSAPLG